jgi:cbb3-type cytochrome c oxidase subunit III
MGAKIWFLCVVTVLFSWSGSAGAETSVEDGDPGARIYSSLCASCHGRYGRGDGPLVEDLKIHPPDFIGSDWLAGRSDEEIVKELRSGSHPSMAVATVLDESALRDAISWVRKLSVPGKYVSLQRGRDIYNASCWVCHGRDGDGQGPAANTLEGAKPRDFTSAAFVIEGREDEVARTISVGAAASFHGSPLMPAWSSQLPPQQIRDVVEYLKTLKKQ